MEMTDEERAEVTDWAEKHAETSPVAGAYWKLMLAMTAIDEAVE